MSRRLICSEGQVELPGDRAEHVRPDSLNRAVRIGVERRVFLGQEHCLRQTNLGQITSKNPVAYRDVVRIAFDREQVQCGLEPGDGLVRGVAVEREVGLVLGEREDGSDPEWVLAIAAGKPASGLLPIGEEVDLARVEPSRQVRLILRYPQRGFGHAEVAEVFWTAASSRTTPIR